MKVLLTFIFCLKVLTLLAQQTIICGHVKHAMHPEFIVTLYNDPVSGLEYDFADSIHAKGNFRIVIDLEGTMKGTIQLGQEKQLIYLETGDSLYITVEDGKFDETLTFSNGKTASNQRFYNAYFQRFVWNPSLNMESMPHRFLDDKENDTELAEENIARSDSLLKTVFAFADSCNLAWPMTEIFYSKFKAEKIYESAEPVLGFPIMKKYFGRNRKPGLPVFPKVYDDYVKRFNLNNEAMVGNEYYVRFLKAVLEMNIMRQIDTATYFSTDRMAVKMKMIDSLFSNQKVRNVVLADAICNGLLSGQYVDVLPMYEQFKQHNFDAILGEAMQVKMKRAAMLKPMDVAPHFELKDIDGKRVSLDQFKGKLVYLDFWATNCGPCIAEFPASKKIQEQYAEEKIVFVFVSVDEDEGKWKECVAKNNLFGIQLFAGGKNSYVAKAYNISAIPEYVLIDKHGRIIEYGAPRPSNKELADFLNAHLGITK